MADDSAREANREAARWAKQGPSDVVEAIASREAVRALLTAYKRVRSDWRTKYPDERMRLLMCILNLRQVGRVARKFSKWVIVTNDASLPLHLTIVNDDSKGLHDFYIPDLAQIVASDDGLSALAVIHQSPARTREPAGKTHPNAGILPQALAGGALKVAARDREAPHDDDALPGLLDDTDWHDTDFLPLFDDGPRDSPIVRMPTLELLHGAGIPAGRPGKGAPGDLRLLYELLIDAPPEARDGGTARLEYSVDDLRRMLASPAPGARPLLNVAGERWGSFMRMLKRARSYTMPADGGASVWLPIAIRSYPQHPAGVLRLDVSLPPGSAKGPRILRKWLRRYGAASYPAWRTWLALAYLWDRSAVNGRWVRGTQPRVARDAAGRMIGADGRVLLNRRSQRVTRWSDPRAVLLDADGRPVRTVAEAAREANPAAERLHPWLSRRDIESLGFPRPDRKITERSRRKRFADVLEVLQGFARDGTITLVERCGRFQLLPPAPDPDAESVPIRRR